MKVLFLLFLSLFSLFGEEDVVIQKQSNYQNLTHTLFWFTTSENLSLEEILAPGFSDKFQENSKETFNLGFQNQFIWIKLPIAFKKTMGKLYLEFRYRQFEKIEMFFLHGDSKKIYQSFSYIDNKYERFTFRNHIFPFPELKEEGDYEVYAKVQFYMPAYFEIWQLDQKSLLDRRQYINFLFGLFYGIFTVVVIYSLTIFFTTKNFGLLYYIFFLFSLGLTDAYTTGTLNVLFESKPELVVFLKRTISSITEFFCLIMIREIIFDTQKNRISRKIFSFLIGLSLVQFFLSLFISIEMTTQLMYFFGTLIAIGLIIILIYNLFLKDANSMWILLSFSLLVCTSLVNFFVGFGILPKDWFISDSLKISAIAQVFIFSFFLSYRINRNREQLKQMNFDLELRVKERTRELSETLSELEERDLELQRELDLSVELLKSLAPKKNALYSLVDFRVFQESFLQIGGDFFDIIQRPDGSIFILIADASGHGISGALLVALYKITFRNVLLKGNLIDPKLALLEINEEATATLTSHNYLTVFLMSLEPNGTLRYSSAGHRPAFIFRAGSDTSEILATRGMLLGISKDKVVFEQKETKLEVGDRILLYTDGVTEIFNADKKILGSNGLFHIFLKTQRSSLDASYLDFLREWRKIKGEEPTKDDSSFLLLEFHGKLYK